MKLNDFYLLIFIGILFSSPEITAAESTQQNTYLQKVTKTAKERLGRKASDQQRVNNCKVPVEKRGSKPRPDRCHRH